VEGLKVETSGKIALFLLNSRHYSLPENKTHYIDTSAKIRGSKTKIIYEIWDSRNCVDEEPNFLKPNVMCL